MRYFGGVEGGSTHSKLVIIDENGETVSKICGQGTNHWQLGIPECARRIAEMIDSAKNNAKIPLTVKLYSLGLSLSGCEQKATNDKLENELRSKHPDIAENYVICSDTVGSIFTASRTGGMVVIAGTGSNALFIKHNKNGSNAFLADPEKSSHRCGGWGHMMGDEGSGWWISHRAIKYIFDHMDNYIKSPYPIDRVWRLAQDHFKIETQVDLLEHCYTSFAKSFFAGLCKKLAELAKEGDQLAAHVFGEAGAAMARYVLAIADNVDAKLLESGTLDIVCVGSVFLSWELLCNSFIKELNTSNLPFGLRLLRNTKTNAYGAAYMAADHVNVDMPRDYQDNYRVFHTYQPGGSVANGQNHMNGNAIGR